MNVLIIEDESLSARRLEKMLTEYDPTIQVLAKLPSVVKTLRWFSEHQAETPPDLVFMDIHLEDDNAFRIIEETQLALPIIFTTAYDQYALQAFKANSIDYLLKPINTDELTAAVDKFKRYQGALSTSTRNVDALVELLKKPVATYKDRFMVTIGPKIQSIPTDQIAYFFYDQKATWVQTVEGRPIAMDYSLEKLTTLLDPKRFFRVNRAFLLAHDSIKTIHSYSEGKLKLDLRPSPRQEVYVSSDRVADFKAWLGK
jgi:DNA-binding LytR/AlgR family response regulator